MGAILFAVYMGAVGAFNWNTEFDSMKACNQALATLQAQGLADKGVCVPKR